MNLILLWGHNRNLAYTLKKGATKASLSNDIEEPLLVPLRTLKKKCEKQISEHEELSNGTQPGKTVNVLIRVPQLVATGLQHVFFSQSPSDLDMPVKCIQFVKAPPLLRSYWPSLHPATLPAVLPRNVCSERPIVLTPETKRPPLSLSLSLSLSSFFLTRSPSISSLSISACCLAFCE